jgi:hypothetical protein
MYRYMDVCVSIPYFDTGVQANIFCDGKEDVGNNPKIKKWLARTPTSPYLTPMSRCGENNVKLV